MRDWFGEMYFTFVSRSFHYEWKRNKDWQASDNLQITA